MSIFDELPEEEFVEGYDPTASFVPLRKGKYEGVLTFADDETEPVDQWKPTKGNAYADFKIVTEDGKRSKSRIFTHPYQQPRDSGKYTSAAGQLLMKLAGRDVASRATSVRELVRLLTDTIGNRGVPVIFTNDWKAECRDCSKNGVKTAKVQGEENFPTTDDGTPIPSVACPNCQQDIPAYAEFRVIAAI
jgi:hypothetical protein